MLEPIFTSRARVKILSLLLFRPTEGYHLRDIARRTGFSPPYVKKELEKLTKIGLVSETTRGNLRIYQANKASILYEDLRRMFLKTELLGPTLATLFDERKSVRYALLYGSFASGKETESSDVDILVIGRIDEEDLLKTMREAEKLSGREINYLLWTEREFAEKARERHHLLAEIATLPLVMLKGDEDEFRRIAKRSTNPED